MFVLILLIFCAALILNRKTTLLCTSKKRFDGNTVLVTGGTSGIGYEIAKDFAERGARVIVACPFQDEGTAAREKLVKTTENDNIVFKLLDLGSFGSVRKFAADIIQTEDRLDILVNNAGIGAPRDYVTGDGINVIMQINYYGHFLLTLLLLPLLKKSGTPTQPSRILNNGSLLHRIGQLEYITLNTGDHGPVEKQKIYGTSKLCLALFTRELTNRLGANVVVNIVDPGAVGTGLFYSGGIILGFITKTFFYNFGNSPFEGAQTAITAAVYSKPQDIRGAYFRNCEISKLSAKALDDSLAKQVWDDSVRLVKLTTKELDECVGSHL